MRINLYGGPGSGKSTTAAWLFSELKSRHHSVELVSEYIKTWAYQKRKVNKYDQLHIFGEQHQSEYKYLTHGVKNIVTDCPVLLSSVYAKYYNFDIMAQGLSLLLEEYEQDFPSFNIILDRGNKSYHQEGRFQTEAEARKLDELIEDEVYKSFNHGNIVKIPFGNKDKILETVLREIK